MEFDAAASVHETPCALRALFDPTVPPAGQLAVYNALGEPKQLFVLTAGHHPYRRAREELLRMSQEIYDLFLLNLTRMRYRLWRE